jgi:hypothetical protein
MSIGYVVVVQRLRSDAYGLGQGRIFGCWSSLRPPRGAWSGARATRGVNQTATTPRSGGQTIERPRACCVRDAHAAT